MSGDIAKELCLWADDPMWADHAEVPKVFLHKIADALDAKDKRIAELEAALEPFGAFAAKARRYVHGRADFGGSPVMPTKHFSLSDFERAETLLSSPAGEANG